MNNYYYRTSDQRFPALPFLAGLAVSPFLFGGGFGYPFYGYRPFGPPFYPYYRPWW